MNGRSLHFIAIGGAGMSGLALVCHRLGAQVTGSDRAESTYLERLRAAGLNPHVGHDADQVPEGAEVVVSTAIAEDNPELARARERGQIVLHRSELLAELCAERRVLAIAGTHGKTSTAAMAIHVLRRTGADPSFFLGGELPGAGEDGGPANAGLGSGEWVVVEADESDGSFLRLSPEVAVITNLELDHHSRWGSLAELRAAFARFAAPARAVIAGAGAAVAPAADGSPGRHHRLTLAATSGPGDPQQPGPGDPQQRPVIRVEVTAASADGVGFTAVGVPWFGAEGGQEAITAEVRLRVHGAHNALNAAAALAAVGLTGMLPDPEAAADALGSFPGVARRMELKGERSGARIYDDYAHHPTEVEATLAAARQLGGSRVIAVFQPHLYSRTKALAAEFGRALAAADEVAVLEVYPAREEPVGPLAGVTGRMVAAAAADASPGLPVWWLPDAEQARAALAPRLEPGDVLLTIGAGDIHELAEALVEGT